MAYHAHLLALRRLQHGERVDDRGKGVGIKRAKALVNEKVVEGNVARRECRQAKSQSETDDECLTARQRRRVAYVVGTIVVNNPYAKRVFHLHQLVARVKLSYLRVGMSYEETQRVALRYLAQRASIGTNGVGYGSPLACRPLRLHLAVVHDAHLLPRVVIALLSRFCLYEFRVGLRFQLCLAPCEVVARGIRLRRLMFGVLLGRLVK